MPSEKGANVKGRVLPTGVDGSLWSSRPSCGVLEFRGTSIRIEVPDDAEGILFPTDCGLSLLAAVDRDPVLRVEGRRTLDVGCGSGLYSLALLAAGALHVTALDVNAAAIEVTRANAVRNGLALAALTTAVVDVLEFQAETPFDLVVSNPPHLPHHADYSGDALDTALLGGHSGRSVYDALIDRAQDLVSLGGSLVMAHSSLADVPRTKKELAVLGFGCRTIEVFEMDIPLRGYAGRADSLMRELQLLREKGMAEFEDGRFSVHVLEFQRND